MTRKTRFVIGGFGNVGEQIARAVIADESGQLEIAAIAARDKAKARVKSEKLGLAVPIIAADEAPEHASVVVEASTYDGFRDVVEPAILAGCHVIAVSVGALGVNLDLIDLASAHGATLQIASGTLPGLDILRSAREGTIEKVRLISDILPRSLISEAYIKDNNIDLEAARVKRVHIFTGSARQAALHFPRHFNVAVSLSLAGIGLDRTQVQIHADGRLPGARHTIEVTSDVIQLEMTSHNLPSLENNRTSRIVAPSILAALRELSAPLRVGS
jgi:aspartate dehydrogenase